MAVTRGKETQVEAVGWNIPAAAKMLAVGKHGNARMLALFHPGLGNIVRVRVETHATVVKNQVNDRRHPQLVPFPSTVTGRIAAPGGVNVYEFEAKAAQKVHIQVEAGRLGSPLDPVLRLSDSMGKMLATAQDSGGARPANADVEMALSVPHAGRYRIEVSDLFGDGGLRYVYRLRLVAPEPDYLLAVAGDRFTMNAGRVSIPVNITRVNGFAGVIEVKPAGLPDGVSAAPGLSLPSNGTARQVTLLLAANKGAASGSFHIVGQVKGGRFDSHLAVAPAGPPAVQTEELWLSPGAR